MELLCTKVLLLTSYAMTYTLCSPAAWSNINTNKPHQHQHQQHQRMSPSDWGLRHGLPDDLPVPDLIEIPNKLFDPRGRDLNSTLLLQKLGRHYDPQFMSIANPRHHPLHPHTHHLHNHQSNALNATMMEFPFRRNGKGGLTQIGEMPEYLRKMNFRVIRLPDGKRLRTRISAKLKKKHQQFLLAYTSCPVVYRWKDLGVRFWPRYLKEGSCPPGKTSCSIPPGMHCRPAAKGHRTLLRYNCRTPHRNFLYSSSSAAAMVASPADVSINTPAPVCKWIEVKYPVVTKCACSCASVT